ncbi:winged helix-turn-helix transcriptional regulator [Haladaptatus caseinilyticus]|uniref:winged helix-turn-helix transcriptional regulator n=1 Tax=Haladaptatus caseinilyticus TaxID=2993314 RepID=UPI0038994879
MQQEGRLTQLELHEKTLLSRSTVHAGIDKLLSCGVIEKQVELTRRPRMSHSVGSNGPKILETRLRTSWKYISV